MDPNDTGQMNFYNFVELFGIMSRATLQDRLKLLFILHIKELTAGKQSSVQKSLENSSNTIESSKYDCMYSIIVSMHTRTCM